MKKNLNVQPVHIKYKKEIGKVNSNKVFEILTTGGFYMEIMAKGAGFEVIGTGSHRGIARHIAENRQPSVVWNEFAKGDYTDVSEFDYLVADYQKATDEVNRRFQERWNRRFQERWNRD